MAYLGTKADADINFLTKADMVGFRDALAAKLSATAARHAFKGSRMIFRAARMDGILSFDPRETVKPTKKADTARRTRRPFTVQETHKILSTCDDAWRGLVIFALHTGQRLGGLARFTRANVDETHGTLNLTTRKTRARIAIPLFADKRAVRNANPAPKGARPEAVPLFPKAWRIVKESGKVSTLSLQFTNILAAVKLREAVTHQSAKKGRDTAREVATVSFHSLRHSAVSLLKAAGVPDATVMALVGHETLAMSSHYTHVGKESLESAVASLPSFVPVPPSEQ